MRHIINFADSSRMFCRKTMFFLAALLVLFTACTPDNENEKPVPETFVECLYSKTISLKDMADELLDRRGVTDEDLGGYRPLIDALLSGGIEYNVHAITYNTVTPNGQPIVASGVVYYPCETPVGVVEVSPICKSKGECGTEDVYMVEALPAIMKGYVCIVADLIGNGTTSDLPISYIQHEIIAIVSADMRRAAEEFLIERYDYQLTSTSVLFGYSLGGASILSLAHLYDVNPSYGVKVEHVFAGGGAYEPYMVFKTQIEEDRSDFASIPNFLLSLMYYDHLDLDLTKIFKGPLLEHYEEWCDGWTHISKITREVGTHPSAYLTEEFTTGLDSLEKYRPLLNALKAKSLPEDWKPTAKIHLCHAIHDYYVPSICGDRLNERLKALGADVEYKTYDVSHGTAGVYAELELLLFL